MIVKPSMEYHTNIQDRLCVTLHNWDTQESIDGYTVDEINELIENLQTAKQHILNSDEHQGVLFEGDNNES